MDGVRPYIRRNPKAQAQATGRQISIEARYCRKCDRAVVQLGTGSFDGWGDNMGVSYDGWRQVHPPGQTLPRCPRK
jgi:hypothetical protein